jgi:O-glycosyl hydrolase
MKSKASRPLCLLCCLVACLAPCRRAAAQAAVLAVDESVVYQTLESFGTSGAWWAQYVGGFDAPYGDTGRTVREEAAMLLFDKDYGIGLTAYRYNLGAGSKESRKGVYWNEYRRAESFETSPFVYDWGKDENAAWMMREAVRLGVRDVVFFCNSPPERLTINGMAQVSAGETRNILPEQYPAFARYVLDVAEHFVNEGIPVRFVSPVNEPQWDWHEGQEGCHYSPDDLAALYRAFQEALSQRPALAGVQLSGPESGEWKGLAMKYTEAILKDPALAGHFSALDNHSYWSTAYDKKLYKYWLDKTYPGTALRTSEWCEMVSGSDYTMDSAYHLAEVIAEDLTILNAVSWQNWVAVAPGGYRDGLIYTDEATQTIEPLRRLWAYGNYSRFIRPGYQRVETSAGSDAIGALHPVAFIGADDGAAPELVLVLINESSQEATIQLSINTAKNYQNIKIYETSENRDLECVLDAEYSPQSAITLSPKSISTVVLSP